MSVIVQKDDFSQCCTAYRYRWHIALANIAVYQPAIVLINAHFSVIFIVITG